MATTTFDISHPNHQHRLIVLVPTHLEKLDGELSATLKHNANQLKGYPLEVIIPETCSSTWFETFFLDHSIQGNVRQVSADYFGSPTAVNRMGTDPAFYQLYSEFEYILICHLDAWIFRNHLAYWMDLGYDFIGAPLFLPLQANTHFLRRMAPFGSNGGLSLRRVDSCIRVLESFRPGLSLRRIGEAIWFLACNHKWAFIIILLRLLRELSRDWRATCHKYNIYEDVFFTVIAPICGNCINIPPSHISVEFACEVNYSLLQKELLRLTPPVGIHGYDKYVDTDYLNYARGFFARKSVTYDVDTLPSIPLVSVVMIVKNLISSGRSESFDRAITSVLNQTYDRVEVLLLDGSSIDGTFSMLQERYGHLGRVVLHCKADNSVWEGMSNGVELATGDLIAVMNSDDHFSSPEALKLMVRKILESNADMAYGHTLLITENETRLFPTHFNSVLYCFGVVHQATLIKKSVIKSIAPFTSGHITAENYLFVAILAAGFKAALVPKTLVHYRVGGLSTTLYGGANSERTINDYVLYMKKLTTIGNYLDDAAIRQLYGFSGMAKLGVVRFTRMVWSVRDRRLRSQLMSGILNILKLRILGMARLLICKIINSLRKLRHFR